MMTNNKLQLIALIAILIYSTFSVDWTGGIYWQSNVF